MDSFMKPIKIFRRNREWEWEKARMSVSFKVLNSNNMKPIISHSLLKTFSQQLNGQKFLKNNYKNNNS